MRRVMERATWATTRVERRRLFPLRSSPSPEPEGPGEVEIRTAKSRNHPEEWNGQEGGQKRKDQDRAIDSDLIQAGEGRGSQAPQDGPSSQGQGQSQSAPDKSQEKALHHQLPEHSGTGRSQGQAGGQLGVSARGSGEREGCNVRAGQEWDQGHDPEEDEEDGSDIPEEHLVKGLQPVVPAGEVRIRLLDTPSDRIDLGLGLLEADALLQGAQQRRNCCCLGPAHTQPPPGPEARPARPL